MKKLAAALAVVAVLGGCNRKDADHDTGALDRSGTDTVVQSGTVKDTTVVNADTSVNVDTVKKTDHIDKKKND
jgi:ABC-type uncharacterized transport system auxiliary subunit